jgi:hypothetical protein
LHTAGDVPAAGGFGRAGHLQNEPN